MPDSHPSGTGPVEQADGPPLHVSVDITPLATGVGLETDEATDSEGG